MRRVHSPYVAEVLDADVTGEFPYIVTRFVPGPTLEQLVRARGPLSGPGLRRLACGTAEALAAIHAAGVVHRDLKPSNVMLTGDRPVVIDFGIAQAGDATQLTLTGLVMGTPGYLAPEVIEGQPSSSASDVHSWGATMAYAATGRAPFGSGTYETIFYRIVSGRPDLAGVPAPLAPLFAAALARDPVHRPTAAWLSAQAPRRWICPRPPGRPRPRPATYPASARRPRLPRARPPRRPGPRRARVAPASAPARPCVARGPRPVRPGPRRRPAPSAPTGGEPAGRRQARPARPGAAPPAPKQAARDVADLLPPVDYGHEAAAAAPGTQGPGPAQGSAPGPLRKAPGPPPARGPPGSAPAAGSAWPPGSGPRRGRPEPLPSGRTPPPVPPSWSRRGAHRGASGGGPARLAGRDHPAAGRRPGAEQAGGAQVGARPAAQRPAGRAGHRAADGGPGGAHPGPACPARVPGRRGGVRRHGRGRAQRGQPRAGAYAAAAAVAWYGLGPGSGRPRRQLNRMAGAVAGPPARGR